MFGMFITLACGAAPIHVAPAPNLTVSLPPADVSVSALAIIAGSLLVVPTEDIEAACGVSRDEMKRNEDLALVLAATVQMVSYTSWLVLIAHREVQCCYCGTLSSLGQRKANIV